MLRLTPSPFLLASLAALAAACAASDDGGALPPVDDSAAVDSTTAAATTTATLTPSTTLTSGTSEPPMCADPVEPTSPPPNILPPAPTMGGALEGQRLGFADKRVDRAKVRLGWDGVTAAATAPYLEKTVAGRTVRVQRGPVVRRWDGQRLYVSTGGRPLSATELLVTYEFGTHPKTGRRAAGIGALDVVLAPTDPAAGPGPAVDHHLPGLGFADVPGSCPEEAMIQYGPFPWDWPLVKFPEIRDCSQARCTRLALGWLRLHHNTWRATQMIAFLESKPDVQKSFYWGQPGTDANGNAVTIKTSPEYWYGPWESARYAAVKEAIGDLWSIVQSAETGGIDVRLVCPKYEENPGNVCFTAQPLGHHIVKGWINFCTGAFTKSGCTASISDTVDEVMHHEPLHHVFVNLHGAKMLKDQHTHGHGNACLSDVKVLDDMYCESKVRHLVEYASCNHDDKAIRTVEAHAIFVRTIGTMVDNGSMTHWPKLADPTPHPPDCVGPIGCLCDELPWNESPDGDGGASSYCEDNDGLATCQKTKFNASETVGICTSCDENRGPGCPCDDLSQPCDEGFCWGDDTGGVGWAEGTCWNDPPPSWACLADCEALLGNGAFCMTDHPDGARCVPYGTSEPEAFNCWWDGGHMDPQELECTMAHECGPGAPGGVTCADLGYPEYFECDWSFRCVANP